MSVLKRSAKWIIDTIPQAMGIQKIPTLFPGSTGRNELKLHLPSYCQTDTYSCGAIAGWSVLEYFHPESDFRSFYHDCAPTVDDGTLEDRLTEALRKRGITTSNRRDLEFGAIKAYIHAGTPIIVAVTVRSFFYEETGHWLVIYGVGSKPDRVFLTGRTIPGFSRQEMTWQEFNRVWSPAGEGLVCSIACARRTATPKSSAPR